MVVAVRAVLIVEVPVDEVVGVVSVRNGFVAAGRAMFVGVVVGVAAVSAVAVLRIRARDAKDVFVDVRFVDVMEVPVVEIVDVSFVQHGGVPASGRVRMRVLVVCRVVSHRALTS
ncbi:MAG: hypothetical protein JWN27_1794 [Candidatus Eremiobacteraeota bacterium]|nr:hypothetical protein [Candidatus Eremiobacteraeota bacterium]